MDNEPFSFETTGYAMEDEGDSPPSCDSIKRSSPPNAAAPTRQETEDHRPTEKPSQQQQATTNAGRPILQSTPTPTQEQNNALYQYARSLLRSEHQRKHEKLTYDQQLEIENLMFLLSRDSKEMCEVALGAGDGETVGQEDDARKLEGVSNEEGGGGEVVRPIGVVVRASFLLGMLVLVALLLWWKAVRLG